MNAAEKITKILSEENFALTAKEIASKTGIKIGTVRKQLSNLSKEGVVTRSLPDNDHDTACPCGGFEAVLHALPGRDNKGFGSCNDCGQISPLKVARKTATYSVSDRI